MVPKSRNRFHLDRAAFLNSGYRPLTARKDSTRSVRRGGDYFVHERKPSLRICFSWASAIKEGWEFCSGNEPNQLHNGMIEHEAAQNLVGLRFSIGERLQLAACRFMRSPVSSCQLSVHATRPLDEDNNGAFGNLRCGRKHCYTATCSSKGSLWRKYEDIP